jgi:hypothetical protein
MQVILPILPMASCFSICGSRDGFVSFWLWEPVGDFWGTLIFLFLGSWSPLGYRNVNNLPSCPQLETFKINPNRARYAERKDSLY